MLFSKSILQEIDNDSQAGHADAYNGRFLSPILRTNKMPEYGYPN
jgi:hypothetical protein